MDVLARARALAAADVLGAIAAPALVVLAERARAIALAVGATASTVRDGDRVALVVVDGEVDDGQVRHGPNAILGLPGVLAMRAPVTVVTARSASRLLELDADEVIDVLAAHPDAARALARTLAATPPSTGQMARVASRASAPRGLTARSPRWPLRVGAVAAPLAVAVAGTALLALGPAAITDHRPALALALTALTAVIAWWRLAAPRTAQRPAGGTQVRVAAVAPEAAARARRERGAVAAALATDGERAAALAMTALDEAGADRLLADLPVLTTAERAALARALAAAPTPDHLLAALAEDDDDDVQAAALRSLVGHARAGRAPPADLAQRLVERARAATAMLTAARPAPGAVPELHAAEVERALRTALEHLLLALALTAAAAGRPPVPVLVAGRRLLAAPAPAHRRALDALRRHATLAPTVRDTLVGVLRPSTGADRRAWSRLADWLTALLAGEHAVREPALAALRACRFFAALPGRHADDLAARAGHRFLAPGDVLVRRGEPGAAMFVVMSGALAVDEPRAAPLGPGAVVGERALVDDAPWATTVRATTLTEVLVLDRPTFAAALVRWPELGVALCRGLVE